MEEAKWSQQYDLKHEKKMLAQKTDKHKDKSK